MKSKDKSRRRRVQEEGGGDNDGEAQRSTRYALRTVWMALVCSSNPREAVERHETCPLALQTLSDAS